MLSSSLLAFVNASVSSGCAVALASICLLQYLAHVHRVNRIRREIDDARKLHDEVRRELHGVSSELSDARRERTINRFEAQVLREFVSQVDCDKAVQGFLRRILPSPNEGFAAFLRQDNGRMPVYQTYGMQGGPAANLDFESEILARTARDGALVLSRQEARGSRVWDSLAPFDRNRVQQLYVFRVGSPEDPAGFLVTTALAPAGVDTSSKIDLARRLVSSIAISLRDKRQLETKEDRIRSTEEMLALRRVADRNYDSPAQMLEELLRQAAGKLVSDRVALYLQTADPARPLKAFIRCGEALQAGVREQWQRHEDELARAALTLRSALSYSPADLERLRITTLLGSALVVPVLQQNRPLGLVCFTRRSREAFAEGQQTLAVWSGQLLADLIPRVASQAVAERQARLDGLTQLANRGEFDRELREQFQVASRHGSSLALLMLDLDHFKSINDTFGHRGGDAVLRAAAATLRECLQGIRSADRAAGVRPFVARYGGEEFALLLQLNTIASRRIGESIRARLEAQPVEFEGRQIRITSSVGLATYPEHADSAEELLAAADAALYQAKANGRNRLEIASRTPAAV